MDLIAWLPHLLWVSSMIVCTYFATLRRSYRECPVVLLHDKLGIKSDPNLSESSGAAVPNSAAAVEEQAEKDQQEARVIGESIRRIMVSLALATQSSRIIWLAAYMVAQFYDSPIFSFLNSPADSREALHINDALIMPGLHFLILIFLSSVALELCPQVISSAYSRKIALGHLPFLRRLESLMSPITRSFRSIHRAMLRAVGAGSELSEADRAEEGIRAAVAHGERQGVLLEGEKSMIESVLDFHEAEVTEVMTPRTDMVAIEASSLIEEISQRVVNCGHSRIPIFQESIDNIIGVLYAKDLLQYVTDPKRSKLPVEQVVRKAHFVPEAKKIAELLKEFRTRRFHIAVVLDEYGGTTGLVTIEDILEEIVGEIEDEYDKGARTLIRRVDVDTFDIDGRAHVDDVSEAIGVEIPEDDDYETLAGFIFLQLGKVPKEGEKFDYGGLEFKVTTANERKIKRVRLKVKPALQVGVPNA